MASTSSDKIQVIECMICKNQYPNQQLFKDHLKNNPACNKLTCDVCLKQYKLFDSLNYHKRTHWSEKPFKCDECEYSTITISLLNRHKRKHSSEQFYKCNYCDYSTPWRDSLDGHLFLTHYTELSSTDELPPRYRDLKKYECELCQKGFRSKYALEIHKRQHKRERPFQCDECWRSYAVKSNLKRHMRWKHSTQAKFTSQPSRREDSTHSIATSGQHISQSLTHSPVEVSSTKVTHEEHVKDNNGQKTSDREKITRSSETLCQCDQCSFSTNSKKKWLQHKNSHTDNTPSTAMEIEETEVPEILTAVDLISRSRLEMLKEEKKFLNLDKPSTSK
ncbi:zinc finger protein 62 homolog [Centruroides sculpturatus]|uniref:zinc finger protein 62 homolog n=1 Tax=Centruroides sculpturatus TaxID=218467 RepID=UPI000C6EDD22|nr:zinc finger protein 62 homolog [Centruroides sculpturatus]